MNKYDIKIINEIYSEIKDKTEKRIQEFENIFQNGNDEKIFTELVFCLLTPQSKAKTCWSAVLDLQKKNLIFSDRKDEISKVINSVRFKNNKAGYIIEARKKFFVNNSSGIKNIIKNFSDNFKRREWFAENVKGIGYKEASHFLRNIGFGKDIAILDRHILKNLKLFHVIDEVPKTITSAVYFEFEKKMSDFSKKINIPLEHLDFVFWFKEAKEVFK